MKVLIMLITLFSMVDDNTVVKDPYGNCGALFNIYTEDNQVYVAIEYHPNWFGMYKESEVKYYDSMNKCNAEKIEENDNGDND